MVAVCPNLAPSRSPIGIQHCRQWASHLDLCRDICVGRGKRLWDRVLSVQQTVRLSEPCPIDRVVSRAWVRRSRSQNAASDLPID